MCGSINRWLALFYDGPSKSHGGYIALDLRRPVTRSSSTSAAPAHYGRRFLCWCSDCGRRRRANICVLALCCPGCTEEKMGAGNTDGALLAELLGYETVLVDLFVEHQMQRLNTATQQLSNKCGWIDDDHSSSGLAVITDSDTTWILSSFSSTILFCMLSPIISWDCLYWLFRYM